jgi:hypothetical protein
MNLSKRSPDAGKQMVGAGNRLLHRSGAVARMLHMPVATLRVWERRYGLTRPETSPSGQRLYSAEDVRRLALVKQLTDLGHAIGSLASLDMPQLQQVARLHAQALPPSHEHDAPGPAAPVLPARAWRIAVIGVALGTRLQRPALFRRIGASVVLLGPFVDAAQAAGALGVSDLDAVLIHEPQLHGGSMAAVDAAAPAFAGLPKAVLYGFASDAVCEALAGAGTALLREPQPDAVLVQWLQGLAIAAIAHRAAAAAPAAATQPVPARRWNDAALAEFAGRSSTIACECPRHVAELLMQLSHFEGYSADCEHRNAADAELHAYLRRVAASARARFESALEQVALHEGLMLPSTVGRERNSGGAR